ncbi:MAG TPA: PilW family protein [Thermoanaerobaculia bacterium]|nr:PilW family protein [Thermoanaerobaculia bacterium]
MNITRSIPPLPLARRAERGYSLSELVVSMTASLVLILGVLGVFEMNSRMAKVQNDLADTQQSLRAGQHELVRMGRMAGRGSLGVGVIPAGRAVAVRNNAAEEEYISPGDDSTPGVLEGTDVVTLRGVFNSSLLQIQADVPNTVVFNPSAAAPTDGTIRVRNLAVATLPAGAAVGSAGAVPQDLSPLIQSITLGRPEALVLVSATNPDNFAVVELDPANSNATNPAEVVVGFRVTGGTYTDDNYRHLMPGGAYPAGFGMPAYLGILEEYRYYVRELRVDAELMPTLVRARTYPNTEVPYASQVANWSTELAENVFDLQAVFGFDQNTDGRVTDVNPPDPTPGDPSPADMDELLYDHPNDDDTLPVWASGRLAWLRVTTLSRTDRTDNTYEAPQLLLVEDHDYAGSELNNDKNRRHRRRIVSTHVELRNVF